MDPKKAKVRLRLFYISLSCCILSALICAGCFLGAQFITLSTYRELTSLSSATDSRTRISAYQRAIRLSPNKPEAYLLLLDVYGEDGIFAKAESEGFLTVYNRHHGKLRKDSDYRQIHAQAGLLYINAYADTSTVRLRMALPFFEEAKQVEDVAPDVVVDCYTAIGQYYRDYIWTTGVKEVSKNEMTGLLENISTTLDALICSDAPDAIYNQLGFTLAVLNLLYDQRDTLAVTTPKETVVSIMDTMYTSLPAEQQLQAPASRDMVRQILQNEEMYYSMIARAYEREGA